MRQRAGVIIGVVLLSITTTAPVWAQDVPAPYKEALTFLGKSGDFKDSVLKVNIPRNDVTVTVANVATPTPFGFGGWIAMTKGSGMDVMMGDLVLLQDEVNPVMSALPAPVLARLSEKPQRLAALAGRKARLPAPRRHVDDVHGAVTLAGDE